MKVSFEKGFGGGSRTSPLEERVTNGILAIPALFKGE